MFELLMPAALVGLVVLSIPVLLHIFKPRKVRQTPFSSLRWLRASQHRLSRRIQWHQLLLLLLRVAFLTLLVLALAKPIFSATGLTDPTDRFVILNVGRTMALDERGVPTPMDQGRRAAEQLIARFGAGDRTTVILAGREARVAGPLVGDAGVYLPGVRAVEAEQGAFDLGAALQAVRPMVDTTESDRHVEVSIVTDNTLSGWSQIAVRRFADEVERPIGVRVVDVSPARPANAWIADARLGETAAAGTGASGQNTRVIRATIRAVRDEATARTVTLTNLPGLPELSMPVAMQPGASAVAEFAVPADAVGPGLVAKLELTPHDALSDDDVYWLNLDAAAALRVLVIEPDATQVKQLQPGYHLRTALESLSAEAPGTLRVTTMRDTDILGPQIADADVVIMVDVPRLSDGNVKSLQQRVAAGAGLVVFLGPAADPSFYNTKMHNPLGPSRSLLPVEVGAPLSIGGGGALPAMSHVDVAHPIFAGLADPKLGDLDEVRFIDYRRLRRADPATPLRALATIGSDTPAVIEHACGDGRVILLNTTGNDTSSNLATRNIYPPLLDQMLTYLSRRTRAGSYEAGDVVTLTLPGDARGSEVSVIAPGKDRLQPTMRADKLRPTIQLHAPAEVGVYTVTYDTTDGERSIPFVVQASRAGSGLAQADEATLRAWWQPAEFSMVRPDPVHGDVDVSGGPTALDPWLAMLAFIVFLTEMFFVHWLCPKVNPNVVSQPFVSRHGFLGPETSQPQGEDRMRETHATIDADEHREASRI